MVDRIILTPTTMRNKLKNSAITKSDVKEYSTSNQRLTIQYRKTLSANETEVLNAEAKKISDLAMPTF